MVKASLGSAKHRGSIHPLDLTKLVFQQSGTRRHACILCTRVLCQAWRRICTGTSRDLEMLLRQRCWRDGQAVFSPLNVKLLLTHWMVTLMALFWIKGWQIPFADSLLANDLIIFFLYHGLSLLQIAREILSEHDLETRKRVIEHSLHEGKRIVWPPSPLQK